MQDEKEIRTMSAGDIYNFKYVYEPRISPDGSQIMFTVSQARREEDDYNGVIWKYSSGVTSPLIAEGIRSSNPVFSHDGRNLLFLVYRKIENKITNEIWVADSNGFDKRRLISLSRGKILSPMWSPKGDKIFFLSDFREEKRVKKSDVKIITRRNYRINGEGYTFDRRTHLFALDFFSGDVLKITSGDYDVSGFDVFPDGQRAVVISNLEPDADFNVNSDLFTVELKSSNAELKKLMPNKGPISSVSISPDGLFVAFIGNDYRFKFNTLDQVWLYDLKNGATRRAAPNLDQSAVNSVVYDSKMGGPAKPVWSSDSKYVYFLSTNRGECDVYRAHVETQKEDKVTKGEHVVNSFDVSANGNLVYTVMDPLHLSEVYLTETGKGTAQVTKFNEEFLSKISLACPEKFTFKARDGHEIDAWYWPPVRRGKTAENACIIEMHGGGGTEGYTFMHEYQCLCAQGYALVTCNFRGTQGYGERYTGELTQHYLEKDYTDNMDLADFVVRQGWADGSKLGIYGGSYGGLLTNWVITHENRFAAAVTDRSLLNLYTFYGTSDDYRRIEYDFYGFFPWDDLEKYYSKSPIFYAKNVGTPLLIVHSEEDYICPISEAEQLFAFLKRMGKEVVFARFPGENHDLSRSGKPRHRVERLNLYLWWFTSHIDVGKIVARPV